MSSDNHHHRKLDTAFASGIVWTAGVKYFTQVLTWGSVVITAQLLSPAEFGISEMATVFVIITGVVAEFGIATAVLQMQDLEERTLRQVHTFSSLISIVAFVLAALLMPLLTRFFKLPGLELLFVFNCIAFLITGFQAVPVGLLQRDMDYRRLSLAEGSQALIQAFGTVFGAWAGWGYWSLTIGAMASKIFVAVLVNIWKPVRFSSIHWDEIRGVLRLGGQVSIGRLAWASYLQSDGIVVGRVLGESTLGMYRMAMSFASAPAEKTSALLMRAAGPLFAKVQNDLSLVRRYFLILVEILLLTILPLMLGLAVVANEAVRVVLGQKWQAAAAPLQILAVYMTLRPLGILAEQVLISLRKTRFTMNMSILGFCVFPVAFYIAATWAGPVAVAGAWMALVPVTVLPMLVKLMRTIELSFKDLLWAVWPALAATGVMVTAVLFLRVWLLAQSWSVIWVLAGEVAAGAVVYGTVLLLFFRGRIARFVRFAREMRSTPQAQAVV